jgi:hypothetical protein
MKVVIPLQPDELRLGGSSDIGRARLPWAERTNCGHWCGAWLVLSSAYCRACSQIRATGARMLTPIEYPKPAAEYADAADRLAA